MTTLANRRHGERSGRPAVRHAPAPGSLRASALVVEILLGILLVIVIASALSDVVERGLLARYAADPASVSAAQRDASDARQNALGTSYLVCYGGVAVAFLVWFHRAYRDRAIDRRLLRYSRGWTIGAWFVPLMNFVRPKQIMDDMWRASGPAHPGRSASAPPRVPLLLHAWWAAFVLTLLLAQVIPGVSVGTTQGPRRLDALSALGDLIDVPSAVLCILVVMRVTARILDRGSLG